MSKQVTIDKMIEMRLTAMADAFAVQADDPKMLDIPFADRVAMLVDTEYTSRKSNRLKRLIKGAELYCRTEAEQGSDPAIGKLRVYYRIPQRFHHW